MYTSFTLESPMNFQPANGLQVVTMWTNDLNILFQRASKASEQGCLCHFFLLSEGSKLNTHPYSFYLLV